MDLDMIVKIAAIATPVVIGLGFYFAWVQWSSMRRTRMAQIVLSLAERWDSDQMAKSRQSISVLGDKLTAEFENALNANDLKFFTEYAVLPNFFDTLGVLVCEGYLECAIAFDILGKAEKYYHGLFEGILDAGKQKDALTYFKRLHELFVKEEAYRSSAKKRHAL